MIVSHDRYLLNELVTEVIEVGQGHAIRYLGNYDDYLAKKSQMASASAPALTKKERIAAASAPALAAAAAPALKREPRDGPESATASRPPRAPASPNAGVKEIPIGASNWRRASKPRRPSARSWPRK